jgi:hypothetical protein
MPLADRKAYSTAFVYMLLVTSTQGYSGHVPSATFLIAAIYLPSTIVGMSLNLLFLNVSVPSINCSSSLTAGLSFSRQAGPDGWK